MFPTLLNNIGRNGCFDGVVLFTILLLNSNKLCILKSFEVGKSLSMTSYMIVFYAHIWFFIILFTRPLVPVDVFSFQFFYRSSYPDSLGVKFNLVLLPYLDFRINCYNSLRKHPDNVLYSTKSVDKFFFIISLLFLTPFVIELLFVFQHVLSRTLGHVLNRVCPCYNCSI